MLRPEEFSVGCIGDATTGLTFVLPRDKYEYPMLVTQASGSPYAIFIAGQHQFSGFECTNNDSWNGVLIANVRIEIDESSVFNAVDLHAHLGTLVRRDTQLTMITQSDGGFRRETRTPLIVGLPACRQNTAAGFKRWQIVIGEDPTKRELARIAAADN